MNGHAGIGRLSALLAAVALAITALGDMMPSCLRHRASNPTPAGVEKKWKDQPVATTLPPTGVILAWNNVYPAGRDSAKWYARTVGLTGTYLAGLGEAAANAPYLRTGLRVATSRIHVGKADGPFSVAAPGTGFRYLHKSGRWVANPWHPDVVPAIERGMVEILDGKSVTPETRDGVRYVLLDSENAVAPPARDLEGPGQAEAVALVADAARKAGALREGEAFPLLHYGYAADDAALFDQDGALRGDSPEYRVLDWWFGQGQGPGRLWRAAVGRLRQGLPRVYAAADPSFGSDSRPAIPVFAAKANGLDFVQNWFYVNGRGDRVPLYAALMALVGKASGLPVVQGPHVFHLVNEPLSYAHDLILTANLLTLAFNPRNGATDPQAPWGVVHWGVRGVTEGATDALLRPYHKKATTALLANLAANQNDVIPAIRATRRFLDEQQAILAECEDVPAKVGIVLSRGAFYVAPRHAWYNHARYLGEFPYALLMAHVPFAFVNEDDDFSRYEVLVLPRYSFPTDRLVAKLAAFRGTVTGNGVPKGVAARIPGWKAPLPDGATGKWAFWNPPGCPGGLVFCGVKADEGLALRLQRAAAYKEYFAALVGRPEVDGDPEVILNVVSWRDRKVVFAVNHRMRKAADPYAVQLAVPWKTEITVAGRWKGGRFSPETHSTAFPVEFKGAGARVIVLEPIDAPGR